MIAAAKRIGRCAYWLAFSYQVIALALMFYAFTVTGDMRHATVAMIHMQLVTFMLMVKM